MINSAAAIDMLNTYEFEKLWGDSSFSKPYLNIPEAKKTNDKIVAKLWDDNYKYKADTNIMRTFKEHGFIPPTDIRTDYFFKPYE